MQTNLPLVNKRFKEPLFKTIMSKRDIKDKGDEAEKEYKQTVVAGDDFKRPSDYRRTSLAIVRDEAKDTTVRHDQKLKLDVSEDSVTDFGVKKPSSQIITTTPTKDSLIGEIKALLDTLIWFVKQNTKNLNENNVFPGLRNIWKTTRRFRSPRIQIFPIYPTI